MSFVDVPSLVIVLGGAGCCYFARGGGRAGVLAVERLSLLIGNAAMFVGLVQMLQALDDPAAIGSALGVAMLTAFYGAALKGGAAAFLPLLKGPTEVPAGSRRGMAAWILVALFAAAAFSGGNPSGFLDLSALLGVGVVAGVIALAAYLSEDGDVLQQLGRVLPGAGLLLLFAGTIGTVTSLSDPSGMGPAMALGLLGYLYAVLGSVVCSLLAPSPEGGGPDPKGDGLDLGGWLHGVATLLGCLALLGMLMAAMLPV